MRGAGTHRIIGRMGFLDRLLRRPETPAKFSQQWSISDPAFAAWWSGIDDTSESVTAYTVIGLSAVIRAIQIITVIATLPLRSFERQGDDRVRIETDFDDPYPGPDGLTPFSWSETVLIHLLLWRQAFLWHEPRTDGGLIAYRPIPPDTIEKVERVNGKRQFTYTENSEKKTVGSEQITYIPGPSLDGVSGHPLLYSARAVYSAAISGDRTAQRMLRRGIRIGGVFSPADGEDDWEPAEAAALLEGIKAKAMGSDNAGDILALNRKVKLSPWTPSNIESQFDETRSRVLMEIEQLFGVPPHLMADTEKQTSWGTGVAEQNLSLARFTLMGWSSRIEQVLSMRLGRDQFTEYDYKGLLQGTPAQEIELLLKQVEWKLITPDEARKVMNLPPLTKAQKVELGPPLPAPTPSQLPLAASLPAEEPDRFGSLDHYRELQNGVTALLAREASSITVTTPDVHVTSPAPVVTFAEGAFAPPAVTVEAAPAPDVHVTVEAAPTPEVHIAPITVTPEVKVELPRPPMRTVIDEDENGDVTGSHEEPIDE